ncbi:hypothetical protein HYC85_010110 [Camellia sinensis]|uniref:Uncharacterized protein n=1 Tax=Camellia sinensis TaxID=4442 RepID=A0A7J7HJS2_CAMSI|nr:hypothetical protein HYC85_010110 [Camellia sinensis]
MEGDNDIEDDNNHVHTTSGGGEVNGMHDSVSSPAADDSCHPETSVSRINSETQDVVISSNLRPSDCIRKRSAGVVDWDGLGFALKPTDYMYIMKCSQGQSFTKGELQRIGNIELSPSDGVLNYGQFNLFFLPTIRKCTNFSFTFRSTFDKRIDPCTVGATLSSLPDEFVDTVGVVAVPSKDSVSERRSKLEFLEMQELIKVKNTIPKAQGDLVNVVLIRLLGHQTSDNFFFFFFFSIHFSCNI